MVSFSEPTAILARPRLKNLQQVQEEIYRQLQLLIPEQVVLHDAFQSSVNGSPLLHLEVLERHPYTHFLRLTYLFEKGTGSRTAPNAHIRMYADARIAEVTSFDPGQACRRSAHPWYPHRPLMQRLWRENVALDKWLGYLLQQGHRFDTMQAARTLLPAETTAELPITVA
jgi:uncharacterized protein YqiB (DUF1249 family)